MVILNEIVRREITSGKEYGRSFKFYYSNLDKLNNQIAKYVKKFDKNKNIKIADFGCGSGIVGCAVCSYLEKIGYKNYILYAIDLNPNQLEGVFYEAKRYKVPRKKIIIQKKDVVYGNLKKFRELFDIIVSRYVLHYLTKKENIKFIKNIKKCLKKDGLFILINLGCDSRSDQKIKNKYINLLETFLVGKHKKLYIARNDEVKKWLMKNRLCVYKISSFYDVYRSEDFKIKFKLNDEQIKRLGVLFRNRKYKYLENKKGFFRFCWKKKIFFCIKK